DEDPDVRRNATNALRKIEFKDALPHLKPMLDDPNFDVRVEAALAISRCAPDEALPLLKAKLQHEENFIVQATLISCIGQTAKADVIPLISPFLDSEDPRVVANTIDAMVKISRSASPDLVEKLKQLLQHEDNRVKSTAIRTLWVWGEFSVLDNLRDFFKSEDKKLVQSATFVIGEIGKEISHDELLLKEINNILTELIGNPQAIDKQIAADTPTAATATAAADHSQSTVSADTHASPAIAAPASEIEKLLPEEPAPAKTVVLASQILPDSSYDDEIENANRFIAAKNFPAAEKIFKIIYLKSPQHLKALLGYANLCFLQKKNNDAARLYLEALSINPNLVKAHFNLGTIFFYGRKYEDAVKHLVKALSLYPKILGAYLILGQIYQIAGKFSESVKLLTHAAALSPRNPVIYQKLATLHIQLRQYDKAIEVLLKAVDISPVDVESNLLLAYCFNLTGQHQKAFSAIDLTLRACAQSPQQDASLRQMLKGFLYLNSILQEQKPGQEKSNDA
ncbi:MAG: HEAT repeat domain-containing protein, partial [Candidatus Riflebacteria bacterium]|nr:HEAT repeat domain-containing protein [Candidatus Riflebacteria bacterium]